MTYSLEFIPVWILLLKTFNINWIIDLIIEMNQSVYPDEIELQVSENFEIFYLTIFSETLRKCERNLYNIMFFLPYHPSIFIIHSNSLNFQHLTRNLENISVGYPPTNGKFKGVNLEENVWIK